MHSDLTQEERNDIMYKFKAGQLDVLVATDIVSRGIDIDDITMVINYDVPHDTEDYVHRIGRTARADRDGAAITLVSEEDQFYFQQTEKFLEKEIQKNKLPENLGDGPEYRKQGKPNKNNNSAKNRRRKDRNQTSHKDKKQHCHQKNNDITERTSNPQNKRTNPMYRDHQYEGKKDKRKQKK